MSVRRCANSQSKQSIVKPFYPMICMHGLADATDSLDRSGQDWPDRVPIRCAILPMELNIVCFSVAASIHSDRRGEGRAVRAAGIH